MAEQDILNNLVSKWVSLAREYTVGAPDIRGYYLYGSHERKNTNEQIFALPLYDQGGTIQWASRLTGIDTTIPRQRQVVELMNTDLEESTAAFDAAGIPAPTEYRVYYEPGGKLDVQLSREIKFLGNDELIQSDGIRLWLGEKAPKR